MTILKRYSLLLIISFALSLHSGTSPFSRIFLGDIDPSLSTITGTAVSDSVIVSNHNYSAWSKVKNTTFSVSTSYYNHRVKEKSGESSSYDRFSFEEISFAMPFAEKHFFGFSYYPVAVVDAVSVSELAKIEDSFENTNLRTLETKKGSVSNASFIYGRAFGGLSLSADASFKFGNYNLTRRYHYKTYVGTSTVKDWEKFYEKKDKAGLAHFALGTGGIYQLPFGFRAGYSLSVPVSGSVTRSGSFEQTTSYGTPVKTISDFEYDVTDAQWPVEYSAGASYANNSIMISYDHSIKKFKGIDTGIDDTDSVDYSRHVLGIRYSPGKRLYDPYIKRMSYSGYLSIEKRPFLYNGSNVYDITGTTGFVFPFNNDRSAVAVNFSYTKSGSVSDNGMEADSFRIRFIFLSTDSWRLKKERYND